MPSSTVRIGNIVCGQGLPLVWMLGPCVIETHDLTLWIADQLAAIAEKLTSVLGPNARQIVEEFREVLETGSRESS